MTRLWKAGERIAVEVDGEGQPLALTWRGARHPVAAIAKRWRVDSGWWGRRIWREHYKLTTHTGLLVIIYRDLQHDAWFLQRLYD